MKKIILIPPCNTYGDILSIIGLLLFLLEYYEECYLFMRNNDNAIYSYYNIFFKNFNKKIYITYEDHIKKLIDDNDKNTFHICNTNTGNWKHDINNYILFSNQKIDNKYYFCDTNPLYNFLNISEEFVYKPNIQLPLTTLEINHIVYYKMIGLNNKVRMEYFDYVRNTEIENITKKTIFEKFNIIDKYNIVNTKDKRKDIKNIKKHINNNYPIIDINNLVEFPGFLLSLIENAYELHLIEGNNCNFIYHCQYKKIINLKSNVYVHIWCRNRDWKQYNLDYAYKMYTEPKLDNWIFVN